MLLAFALLGASGMAAYAQGSAAPIKIGGIFTQEGPAAAFGIDALNGVKLAIDQVNEKGGVHGRKLQLLLNDDKGDTATAAALMRKVTADKDVLAVLFAPRSPVLIALSAMAPQLKVPLVGIGSASPWPGEFNEWTFRFSQVDDVVAREMIPKVKAADFKPKSMATLYAYDDEWAKSLADLTDGIASKSDIKVVAKESFRTKDTDFRAQLTKIAQLSPDVLTIVGLENEASLIMVQARQLGIKARFMGYSGMTSPKLIELAGPAAEGAITGIAFLQSVNRPETQAFLKAYKAKYDKDAPANAAHGYDAVLALTTVLRNGSGTYTRQSVRDGLGSLKDLEGATGKITMRGKGDADRQIYIVEIRNGTFKEIQ